MYKESKADCFYMLQALVDTLEQGQEGGEIVLGTSFFSLVLVSARHISRSNSMFLRRCQHNGKKARNVESH